jgi:hypothetical protein
MKGRQAVGSLVVAMALATPEAIACSPLLPSPPPPRGGMPPADAAALDAAWVAAHATLVAERKRQSTAEAQRELFDRAGSVFLARLDQIDEVRSVLAPVMRLKGEPAAGQLVLSQTTWSTCGPSPAVNGVYGQMGDVFVVYLKGQALLQGDILNALPVTKIADEGVLALLISMPPEQQ